ncbi:dihydrolipoyl dehydrogenase family protein [Nocardioides insulae]|uniref:dihydrolipoyl dehydrogenase family protein n=1 Tax=Nocardioides insulae TaxID=394734 RepID=UPI00040F8B50|nr:NAD(P)/FAD-dependent oxidoreductase [Nocardioides insulae]
MTTPQVADPSADLTADVVVLGLGVAGESVATQLARAGVDVLGIEAGLVGGECPYWGCIPSKMMLRAAHLLTEAGRVPRFAGQARVSPDWAPVARRIREEATTDWDDTVAVQRYVGEGGRFLRGRGRILGPRHVEVPGTGVVEARRALVITTGTEAAVPPIPGLADTPYWTNREAIETEAVPATLAVLGAGAIGCELGQVFARFGSEVTLLDAADRPIPMEEPAAGRLLADALRADGITLRLGDGVDRVDHVEGRFRVETAGGKVEAERLLIATGRRPRIDAQAWAALGLEGRPGALPVDDRLRVTDGVWAAGDIAGQGGFTHVATYHADIVAREILGREGPAADHRALPRVTFTEPEVGAVGLTEEQARARGLDVAVGSADVAATSRGWIHGAGNAGLIKLVVDRSTDELVGATSAGPAGGEILGALAVAVHGRVPASTLEQMIWAYPTFHRGIQDALRDLRS